METVVSNWGNSLGVRIPKAISDICNLKDKTRVKLEAQEDYIIITKLKEPRKHITLEERAERLAGFDGKPYEITEEDREWLNMPSVGKEIV
jgi:antitoxin component of MazEF toxin-antitoxin module